MTKLTELKAERDAALAAVITAKGIDCIREAFEIWCSADENYKKGLEHYQKELENDKT